MSEYDLTAEKNCYAIATGVAKSKRNEKLKPLEMVNWNGKPVLYLDLEDAKAACKTFRTHMNADLRVFKVKGWEGCEVHG
ncbi:hypothetical protein [Levilactobacillus enshiensis]|uniref:hypothetical protein n=1 Tax=Levilactobacillus enshiensis TaxID=2590213 RepID=UPI001179AAF6|nr:hypothetical protein [Levilactobacillus enshiensis]